MLPNILAAGLLTGLTAATNLSTSATPQASGTTSPALAGAPPCDALIAAGLRDRLLLPVDPSYEPQIESWWSANARLHPWCLVLPETTAEVSLTLTTLLNAGRGAGDWHIAVRSGGHSWPGSNNVANGVTIDLSFMNSSTYDSATNTARVEPGARWGNVYADLQKAGVTVVGGRDGGVGVGGFLLGGGLSFFTLRLGFACDSVGNYEVVLPNGTVVNANATSNPDLFKALKGGGSNYGIVTRYDLEAIPSRNLAYDLLYLPGNYSQQVIDTVVDYAKHDEMLGDNALVTFYTHNTSVSATTSIGVIHVNIVGNTNVSTSFDNLKKLPALFTVSDLQTMAQAAAGSVLPAGTRNAGSTQTFKNDPVILQYCVQLHEEYVATLKQSGVGAGDFETMMFFQPLPSYVGQLGRKNGGNMLGLDHVTENAVLWTGGVAVNPNAPEGALALAQAELNAMSAKIKQFAGSVNGGMELVYLNYADASQDALGSYGTDNVQFLRDVAKRYDPLGAFQTRIPGGFKIGRV
ncbi:hypothetical protein QBC46DRAFT_357856 [Diplogelasinospora grovesii]|uniref:FAD-binding PCMH-type domain-containing protein n=1 Tax=Diplogelasinospora grovesii TaxID=303347 RepID=A0AAN6MZQ9_9PEZI|nr:hypothetical protein QBC46DRAFT_357856 [Diplogelasinospora grovesii]